MLVKPAAGLIALAVLVGAPALAASLSIQKSTLQEQPFPGPVNHTVLVKTVVAQGAEVAPHTHPGVEMAFIAKGQALVTITGHPDQTLRAGGSFSVPEGVVHSVRNSGPGPLIIVSTYVVDKTKPIASPAK